MSLRLRDAARVGDLPAVEDILLSAEAFTPGEIDVAKELVLEHAAKGTESGYHFLLADADGRTQGYICYGPDACSDGGAYHLYWIAVHAGARGLGLARALLDAARDRALAAGGRAMYAETSSTPPYADARGFYEHTGFFLEARVRDFYKPGDDKLIYTLKLSKT
ncbi:GCN5-related N-acetyltransferase [Desulfovibrio sp. X2]|uniref:GNAT family N-acetyltransferase n=1 Tax=Desulfovibrio sp. X2 TaxID=941449 RepID=UPI0003587FBB|nr:GNAT family N-acetyltransferase [Desulfovibrio sp. X2]EPR43667.1 GCN5-related N-acetyltransferase [Desulfovibrio sp. X2]